MGNHYDPRDEERAVPYSPLDEYKRHRKESERKLEQLINYREHCRISAQDATRELDEVENAIGELETLLQLKQQPEGSR